MARKHRLLVLEFNELTPALMERFISDGSLPNFHRIRQESFVYRTLAAERPPYLDPWVQWVTVHTGLNYEEHGVQHLNEGDKLATRRVWDLVSEAGRPVLVWGSMSSGHQEPLRGALLPDPWTTRVPPSPLELQPFSWFAQQHVLEHTNPNRLLRSRDYASFVTFMVRHGLTSGTMLEITRQLLSERVTCQFWKRAALLDRLLLDTFSWYFQRLEPDFATFFSNSTAHYQHYHWREMEPDLFTVRPSPEDMHRHRDTIRFGYVAMDNLLGRILRLVGSDTIVVFCTALSQQACLTYEANGGKVAYRPHELARILDFAGVPAPYRIAPVMSEQFNVFFDNEDAARHAAERLARVSAHGRPILFIQQLGIQLHLGCSIFHSLPVDTAVALDGESTRVAFFNLFYQIDGMKSGMHHPEGMLWIRTPERRHVSFPDPVALASVAPTLLDLLGIDKPEHMKEESLLSLWPLTL